MARPLKTFAPAFIHVDVDDLWAVAECYGLRVADELAHAITADALPRFQQLFREQGIHATFFLVGRDLESAPYVEAVKALLADGHTAANHSYSHRLDFRALSAEQITAEISRCHSLARDALGIKMQGFRAPGYAASTALSASLQELGYRYDASLMPSPFGGVFRWMDARLQKKAAPPDQQNQPKHSTDILPTDQQNQGNQQKRGTAILPTDQQNQGNQPKRSTDILPTDQQNQGNQQKRGMGILPMNQQTQAAASQLQTAPSSLSSSAASPNPKTQYPLFRDTFHSLRPAPLSPHPSNPTAAPLIRLPSATTPLLRLPFQAGVCMRLGLPYFRACFEPYRRAPHLPFVFLFHAADLADFSQIPIPFFQESSFFSTPITQRLALAERFIETIRQSRQIITTEEWLDG